MVETATDETGEPHGRQTDSPAATPETTDESAIQALRKLNGMMPVITQLAEETKAGNIRFHAERLRDAVGKALTDVPEEQMDPPEQEAQESGGRDSRLLAWARGTQYDAPTPFDVQGRMISNNRTWAERMMDEEVALHPHAQTTLPRETRNTAAYRVLKGLARTFDPQNHGTVFRVYAEPYLRGAARHCLAAGSCIVPNKTDGKELEVFLAETTPPGTSPPAEKIREEGPTRWERNVRLREWGQRHNLWGRDPFTLQGSIILKYIEEMRTIAAGMSGTAGTMDNKDLQTAGYRTLKGLVILFDPATHGENFWVWAEPFVRAAMQRCNNARCMVIPDKPDATFLAGLLNGTPADATEQHPDTPPPAGDATAPTEPPHEVSETADAAPLPQAGTSGDNQANAGTAAALFASHAPASDSPMDSHSSETDPNVQRTSEDPPEDMKQDTPEDPPEDAEQDPPDDPDPEPPAREPSAEEIEEGKRQRRFCRFARDAFVVEVGQDQFAEAVEGVCGKLENLVGSTVSGMHLPGKFRGGKTAVRKEGMRLLPDIVVRYDPPNIQDPAEAKGRFITHVRQRLAPQLETFVRG